MLKCEDSVGLFLPKCSFEKNENLLNVFVNHQYQLVSPQQVNDKFVLGQNFVPRYYS